MPGNERELQRILDAAPIYGESVQRAFDRKEAELGALFTQMAPAECAALHAKLANDDGALKRLTAERRGRVVAFLARAARRKAGGK